MTNARTNGPGSGPVKPLRKFVALIEQLEKALCAFFAFAFTCLIVVNVVLRYAFNQPLFFAEEVSIVLMIWMTLLAASLMLGRRQMVSVTILADALPQRARWLVTVAAHAVTLIVAVTFFYWSIQWMGSPVSKRDVILALDVPKWYSYMIIPVFFCLASIKAFNNMVLTVVGQE